MPGPLVHKAAMENLQTMLQLDGISVDVGTAKDNMATDLTLSPHGYSMETNTGSIFDKIETVVNRLSVINNLSKDVRHICHLCTDSMSIGQISSDLWGKYDDRFDALGELVIGKRNKGTPPMTNPINIQQTQRKIMTSIYEFHRPICTKWNYCLSKNFRNMVKDCVYYGPLFAYSWVKFGLSK